LPTVACGPPSASPPALAWRDLLAQPLVTFPPGYQQRQLIEARAAERGLVPRIVLESEHVAVLLEAVRAGLGMTTLLEPAARDAGVGIHKLEEDSLLQVNLCHRRDYPLTRVAQALADHLAAFARD
jgi:DNA-binding transcriptional LysR family regulator